MVLWGESPEPAPPGWSLAHTHMHGAGAGSSLQGRPPPGCRGLAGAQKSALSRMLGFLSRLSPLPPLPQPIWNLLPLVSAAERPLRPAPGTGPPTLLQPEPPWAA